MRILLIGSTRKCAALEQTLADVAVNNGWKLTVIQPGSEAVRRLITSLLAFLWLVALAVSYYFLRVRYHPRLEYLIAALAGLGSLFIGSIYGVQSLMTMAQLKTTVRAAHEVVEAKKPNMVVTIGYGGVIALENELLRQLPLLMLSPSVLSYAKQSTVAAEEQGLLNLEDSPYTYVTYDTTQDPKTLEESMLLAGTAEPGTCTTDMFAVRFADETSLRRMIIYTFTRGWQATCEREGIRIITDVADADGIGDARVSVEDATCSKTFFKDVQTDDTHTEWLSQNDLELLSTSISSQNLLTQFTSKELV